MKVLLVLLSVSAVWSSPAVVKRQTQPGQFDLFGQVLSTFHNMLNTLGSEGGSSPGRARSAGQPSTRSATSPTPSPGLSLRRAYTKCRAVLPVKTVTGS